MPAGNPDFDELLTTTMRRYRAQLVDNVFTHRPLLDFLRRRDRIKYEDGGESIVVPLMYGTNSTAKSYAGYDQLDISPQGGITSAQFAWRQYAVTIAISGIEEAKNQGRTRVINLLEAKTTQAEQSAMENMNTMFYLNGTGNAGKDWDGLAKLVSNHTLGPAIVGGIDCSDADNAWWRSIVQDAASTVRDSNEWANVFNTASRGADQPDFVITTQGLWEHYESSLVAQLRFTSNDEADGRFMNLLFKGRPVFWDVACQTGVTYMLNSRYLGLTGHSSTWFSPTPFVRPRDHDARWSQILSYGNMWVSNRRRQAKIVNQTLV